MEHREDLTRIPLVTIDPHDAKDHDDAVWAEPDTDPANEGGATVIVAIADVSFYVRSGTALDNEAALRGNSVYFPDQVVPMLPEKLSNDLCSLRDGELRPCLAVRMTFDRYGKKLSHRFVRATMRSAAKLSYQEAQAAIDGQTNEKTAPLLDTVLRPLWQVYGLLKDARDKRGPLDLDLPERKIVLDERGLVLRVIVPERLEAHRLIEEFMIQANVAAAEALEAKKSPLIYRVHDARASEKAGGALRVPGQHRHQRAQNQLQPAGSVQPHPGKSHRHGARGVAERGGAAQPGAGRVPAGQSRPFRPEPAPLRAFHLADPPLCRS